MAVKAAEAAWTRIVELSTSEAGKRSARAAKEDALAARWHAAAKKDFLSAWRHVSSMAGEEQIRDDYAAVLTDPSAGLVRRALEALNVDLNALLLVVRSEEGLRQFRDKIHAVEAVLVACLGHYHARARGAAVRMLNCLYDGVDWQLAQAHRTALAFVGEACEVEVSTTHVLGEGEAFRVLVSAPAFEWSGPGAAEHVVTLHEPSVEAEMVWVPVRGAAAGDAAAGSPPAGGELLSASAPQPPAGSQPLTWVRVPAHRVRLPLAAFSRCGYVDWRVVAVTADGTAKPVPSVPKTAASPAPPQAAEAALDASAAGEGSAAAVAALGYGSIAQGRWVVQRSGLRSEHWHEVVVDLEGMRFGEGGDILRHGTFADVAARLAQLKASGVSSLYVLGALERDNGWGETDAAAAAPELTTQRSAGGLPAGAGGAASGVAAPALPNSARLGLPGHAGRSSRLSLGDSEGGDENAFGYFSLQDGGAEEGGVVHRPSTVTGPFTFPLPAAGAVAGATTTVAAASNGPAGTSPRPGGGSAAPAAVAGAGIVPGNPAALAALLRGAAGGTAAPSGAGGLGLALPGSAGEGGAGAAGAEAASAPGADDGVSGTRAFAARPDANPHAVVDRHIPNRMLGGHVGFASLVAQARALGMRLVVQCDASVSASRPHRKYRSLYAHVLDMRGQAAVHAGTDSLENQWEDTQLLNYRKLEAWDVLLSEVKTLVQVFGIGGLYLPDAQSYPFIQALDTGELFRRDADGEGHYSAREVLEGEVVVANSEVGYWGSRTARTYANPFLVKLTRSLWAIAPDFSVAGESHWGRAPALARSGVLPHALDVVSAMACALGRFVDKNGLINSVSLPREVAPVHVLKALLAGEEEGVVPPQAAPQFAYTHLRGGGQGGFPHPLHGLMVGPAGSMPAGGATVTLRSLSSARLPYPALLLGRSAWTGVDLLYSLPGMPMTFGQETQGAAFRVDVAGTYTYNERYLEEEARKRERRVKAERHALKHRALPSSASGGGSGGALGVGQRARSGGAPATVTESSSTHHAPASRLGSGVISASQRLSGRPPSAIPPRLLGQERGHGSMGSISSGSGSLPSSPSSARLEDEAAHLGVGGVIPAAPLRGSDAAPSYKLHRTGFSTANLAGMGASEHGASSSGGGGDANPYGSSNGTGAEGGPLLLEGEPAVSPPSADGDSGRQGHFAAGVPLPSGGRPPLPPSHLAVAQQYQPVPAGSGFGRSGGLGGSRMPTVSSSPALQSLLLLGSGGEEGGEMHAGTSPRTSPRLASHAPHPSTYASVPGSLAVGGGHAEGGLPPMHDSAVDPGLAAGVPNVTSPHGAGLPEGPGRAYMQGSGSVSSPTGTGTGSGAIASGRRAMEAYDEEGEEEGAEDEEGAAGAESLLQGGAAGSGAAASASTTFGFHIATSLFDRPRAAAPTAAAAAAAAGGRKPSTGSAGGWSEASRVQSWVARESPGFSGASGSVADSVRRMGELEARLRSDVGPQYGFDLQQIGKHYEHRRRIRSRFSVLREGQLAVLTARHRFGEHGHVLAYARYAPGQVAVVAANFNGHPSTFATDCSAVTAAFGASTAAEASASVAELMEASAAVGEALSARSGGAPAAAFSSSALALPAAKGVAGSSPGGVLALTMPLPSLNLRGGVWEVRDIFASSAAGYSDEAFNPTAYNASDGPLVGIVTSEEAAYAPILATLPPHRSHCWLYCAASGSKGAAGSASAATPAGAASGERLAETDPAAMQWLFASSLLRLQSVLRLKESGLASSVITLPEVEAAGGYAALLAQRREGREGGGAGGGHGWIAPGEALKDEEIMAAARHNLVYSLLRHVVKRTYRSMAGARAAGVGAAAGAGGSPRAGSGGLASIPSDKQRAIVKECAGLLDAAFRVLVTHLQLRREQDAGVEGIAAGLAAGGLEGSESASGRAPPSLVGAPLPSLHGAMNRGAGIEATPSAAAAAGDPAWFAIDASAAVSVLRAALFLAVKDVVAQAAGALPSADVSDEDAALSAVLVRSLTSVAAGRTAAGQAARPGAAESLGVGSAASTALAAVSASAAAPSALLSRERAVLSLAARLLWSNTVSPIVFITPELGKWSTVGGLGVMVDELSIGLAELGAEVVCISPYYNVNRKGVGDYLRTDGILYTGRNVAVWVGDEKIEMGVHEGRVKGVRVFFLHNATVFPKPYPTLDAHGQVRVLSAFAKGCLELLCQWREIPSLVVTNDWFTGLVPAYARHGHFGDVFNRTDFMHIAHNLDADYEGRLYPDPGQGTLSHLHGLPSHLLVDPHWSAVVVNPSRAALLCTDTWATVSRSYRQDLLGSSALAPLLRLSPHPFAHPNGIPVKARLARLASLPHPTHAAAKAALQRKYFGFEAADESMPLFAFVGRITMQKGVHLILQSVEEILRATGGRAMFLVGGMASASDTYGNNCAGRMRELHHRYPDRFWANPDLFFTDGDLVNLGADFCLMPSMFEPGGIVQQEFFVAGTPVIAYKTGGLKDTVFEFESTGAKSKGNGFTFEGYQARDFVFACQRAIAVYSKPAEYARLRANARASVMDLEVVSKAWFREFHRLRRALPPPPVRTSDEHVVEFAIRTGAVPGLTTDSTVAITGSFFNWTRNAPLTLAGDTFSTTLTLPAGVYQYKFIVDGHWTSSPAEPTVDDGTGNVNNMLRVQPSPAEFEDDE